MTPEAAVEKAIEIYDRSVEALRTALEAFIQEGIRPAPELRQSRAFSYPEIRVVYDPEGATPQISRAFAKLAEPGVYATTVTQPKFFAKYLISQLSQILADYPVTFDVTASESEIPYNYVLDSASNVDSEALTPAEFAAWFPTSSLQLIGDEVADGEPWEDDDDVKPLALFDAQRVDYSLKRLAHYTGTPIEHFQRYILFTNYHRYVDHFIEWGVKRIRAKSSRYHQLSSSGGVLVDASTRNAKKLIQDAPWKKYQMPAYHLMGPDDASGVTLINIGVGPSNAKTITDHLAVLRPEVWLMVGHCGGLRQSQRIGDYVLAHAYLRDDHVLDHVLPPDIPVPALAEVQVALQEAAVKVTGEGWEEVKGRLRTGTVVSTDDRNWELRFSETGKRFNQSRAIGIDMESATIAANGYRLRVPYGTLLCVSDKPLHGELKLPGAANRFYERAVEEHIRIGIETLERLASGDAALHSRKLRAFDEPPFR